MSVLIGLDVGTSGARAIAVDDAGRVVAQSTATYPVLTPRPGWSEQHPEDWWRGAKAALGEVAGEVPGEVAGVGLAGQMHGSVFLDTAGEVIRPALLWNDQRTAIQCREISDTVGKERLLSIAGNPALTGFQAPKILWLRDEEPGNFARVARVLLPKDYIRFRLTGDYATDVSDASGTLLLNVAQRNWSDTILNALGIPRDWLPTVHESPEQAGALRADIAQELGLRPGLPVAAGAGDNAAAALGTGIVRAGLVSSSIGTSGVVSAHASAYTADPSGRLHAFCHAVPGAWHLMGVTLSAGGSLAWWRDVLGVDYDALIASASSVQPGSEGLVFLPYLSGERTPHLDPSARGSFFGLTARHGLAHMTRAVMEGVVFSLRDSLEALGAIGVPVEQVRATGGGARVDLWRRLQADIFDLPVRRTAVDEGPAFGAALLAGVAAGLFADVDEAASLAHVREETDVPDPEQAQVYRGYYEVYRSLYGSTESQMHRLTSLASGHRMPEG